MLSINKQLHIYIYIFIIIIKPLQHHLSFYGNFLKNEKKIVLLSQLPQFDIINNCSYSCKLCSCLTNVGYSHMRQT